MGEALNHLGAERVLIAHGKDGLDEISPVTETAFVEVWDGVVRSGSRAPKDFGIDPVGPEALTPGTTPAENAKILEEAISDAKSPRCFAILPSAAAAVWLAGLEPDLISASERAREAVASGNAMAKLNQLVASVD
jgi:anthranilate phosphoribosyltransferase